MDLMERAAALAGETLPGTLVDGAPAFRAAPNLEEPDLGDLTLDAAAVPVHVAWSRVMGEIRVIGKDREFKGGRAGNFMFRGIDEALNTFGPACRKHGVIVMPVRTTCEYRDISTASGGKMRECTSTVDFRIYGPSGDFFEAQVMGEASDSGGRSTPKAQAIALRTLLLGAGLVPTEERDADADHFERGEAQTRSAASYVAEIFDPSTTRSRMQQVYREVVAAGLGTAQVRNELGEDETLRELIARVGKDRAFAANHPTGHARGEYDADCHGCKADQAQADRAAAAEASAS